MRLYLVRHGKYHATDNGSDPLSEEGRKETEKVALKLKKENKLPQEIRHSEKLRAKQTAEIIGDILGVKCIEVKGIKPMDPIGPTLNEIQSTTQDLMFVGHLPFMESLISSLLPDEERVTLINSCGVCLEKKDHIWRLTSVILP